MAQYFEPTEHVRNAYVAFVAELPESARAVAERFNPWTLYRIRDTNHRAIVRSFHEHENGSVTLTVSLSGEFNALIFDRDVFGIKPEDLTECDLPSSNEVLGTLLEYA